MKRLVEILVLVLLAMPAADARRMTMAEVIEHLYNKEYKGQVIINDELKTAIDAYYEQYGAK